MSSPEEPGPREDELAWLLQPVAATEVRLSIAVGDDVELSEEARAAIETLLRELHGEDAEVSGFAFAKTCTTDTSSCSFYRCGSFGKCQPESRFPCLADYSCKIASFGIR